MRCQLSMVSAAVTGHSADRTPVNLARRLGNVSHRDPPHDLDQRRDPDLPSNSSVSQQSPSFRYCHSPPCGC